MTGDCTGETEPMVILFRGNVMREVIKQQSGIISETAITEISTKHSFSFHRVIPQSADNQRMQLKISGIIMCKVQVVSLRMPAFDCHCRCHTGISALIGNDNHKNLSSDF